MYGEQLKKLRNQKGLTQSELGNELGVIKQTISNWENNISEPDIETLVKYADYFGVPLDVVIGRSSIGKVLGYDDSDEHASTFQHKLANQIDFSGAKIGDLAECLGVPEKLILDWLTDKDSSYSKYYPQLSKFFNVSERYWTSPNAISPGIEPNMEEYLLILMRRDYMASGEINSAYGSLEDYFPGIQVITDQAEADLIRDFRKMNQDSKDIVKGKCKEVLRTQRYDEANEDAMELPKASGKY